MYNFAVLFLEHIRLTLMKLDLHSARVMLYKVQCSARLPLANSRKPASCHCSVWSLPDWEPDVPPQSPRSEAPQKLCLESSPLEWSVTDVARFIRTTDCAPLARIFLDQVPQSSTVVFIRPFVNATCSSGYCHISVKASKSNINSYRCVVRCLFKPGLN